LSWNYHITKRDCNGEPYYEIREVYYHGDDISWTANPIAATGDTPEEVWDTLVMMLHACTREVLDLDEMEDKE